MFSILLLVRYFLYSSGKIFVLRSGMAERGVREGLGDYYAVLGIRRDSSSADVRSAYRKLALVSAAPRPFLVASAHFGWRSASMKRSSHGDFGLTFVESVCEKYRRSGIQIGGRGGRGGRRRRRQKPRGGSRRYWRLIKVIEPQGSCSCIEIVQLRRIIGRSWSICIDRSANLTETSCPVFCDRQCCPMRGKDYCMMPVYSTPGTTTMAAAKRKSRLESPSFPPHLAHSFMPIRLCPVVYAQSFMDGRSP